MIVLVVLLAIAAVIALYVIVTYNGFISVRNRIENAWSQIDVQLQRRYDLIPNLVDTVEGYATHERATFDSVTEARAAAIGATGVADQARAENALTGALRSLFAVAEAYPDLEANASFLSLQEELSGTEGKIAYARQFHNDVVQRYNTKLQTFPSTLVGRSFGFVEREYFEADEVARGSVRVDFGQ